MSDAGIAIIATGVANAVAMIVGFLTLWIKLRYGAEKAEATATDVAKKLDVNTALTRKAEASAMVAADKAEASTIHKVDLLHDIQTHVNGGVSAAIRQVFGEFQAELKKHQDSDDVKMADIFAAIQNNTNKLHTLSSSLGEKD